MTRDALFFTVGILVGGSIGFCSALASAMITG